MRRVLLQTFLPFKFGSASEIIEKELRSGANFFMDTLRNGDV
jgi:hypothetical protein